MLICLKDYWIYRNYFTKNIRQPAFYLLKAG